MAEKKEKNEAKMEFRKELIKTLFPIVMGIIAGSLSFLITGSVRSRDPFGIIILVFLIYVQKFAFPRFGIELEGKDWLGISFLSLASWYVTWTLLLNPVQG
jgi:lipopolysaccharide export LptBFGC system permease protein LptF